MATHSGILTWRSPWTEEPCRLQSIGSQIVGHDWSDWAHTHTHILQYNQIIFQRWKKEKSNLIIQRGIENYYNKWNPSTGLGSLFF